MSIWNKTSTWEKVQLSINILLSMVQGGLILGDSKHIYSYIVLGGQICGALIGIWMVDKNKDGIPDIFEKEIVTKVTSETPITVTTDVVKKPDQ